MTNSEKCTQMGRDLFKLYKTVGPDSAEYKELDAEFTALSGKLDDEYLATLTRRQRRALV